MSEIFCRFGDKSDSLELVRQKGNLWGVDARRLVLMDQTHSALVRVVEDEDLGSGFVKPALPVVDAVCTDKENVLLVVKGADCVPILFFDPQKRVVAAAHSGRVGTQNSICTQVINTLQSHYGCKPQDLLVKIGPGVSAACYPVSAQVYEQFVAKTGVRQPLSGCLDLRAVIVADLQKAGVPKTNVECNTECTYSCPKYFSYRQDAECGRQLSAIGVLDGTDF